MKVFKSHKCFEGEVQFWSHDSTTTRTEMRFATFVPKGKVEGCIIWLSGLTCTEENFIAKAGAQRYLSERNLMLICPDTSPRGLNLPNEHEAYDFGSGAGFYVDAILEPYCQHYRMYSYVNEEIYGIAQNYFKQNKISIMGHSMGGHGALVIALRNPQKYKSVSAFAPIVNPMAAPWGIKAFNGYLSVQQNLWKNYDACELIQSGNKHPNKILLHQGRLDEFLEKQLLTNNFVQVCQEYGQKLDLRYAEGYDHSYYFIASFIDEHIKFHAQSLDL